MWRVWSNDRKNPPSVDVRKKSCWGDARIFALVSHISCSFEQAFFMPGEKYKRLRRSTWTVFNVIKLVVTS